MTDSYTEQLESRIEELQDQLSSLKTSVETYMLLRCTVTEKHTGFHLVTKHPTKPGDGNNGPVPQFSEVAHCLGTAHATKVNEVKCWYVEFCTGESTSYDPKLTLKELTQKVAKRFNLVYIPFEVIIKDPNHADFKGYAFVDTGYIYAPYSVFNNPIPIAKGGTGNTPATPAPVAPTPATLTQQQKNILQRYANQQIIDYYYKQVKI